MGEKRDHQLCEMSEEKKRDLNFANQVAQMDKDEKETTKRITLENKQYCRTFWEEQM